MQPDAPKTPALPHAFMRFTQGRPVHMANGTLEALKWLALVLMTLDHVNKYVFWGGLPGAVEAGRLVLPIFGFVLGYNLARPDLCDAGLRRMFMRLLAFGAMATPVFVALSTALLHRFKPEKAEIVSWLPLNILFTLLLATVIVAMLKKSHPLWPAVAASCFILGGAVVEYRWFGLAFVLASWYHCRHGSPLSVVLLVLAAAALTVINGNFYALLSLPLLLLATRFEWKVPRWRHVFYAYYPLHLAAIWMWLYGSGWATRLLAR